MNTRNIVHAGQAASCYFRTSVQAPHRKALVQIEEWCNLGCAHCFVSAGKYGPRMPLEEIRATVIPRLAECRVNRVTLTGGEPFAHPNVLDVVRAFREAGMGVGLCTNATMTSDEQIAALAEIGEVHINVSLDGFAPESHGKFRGNRASFYTTVATAKKFAAAGLLQGLLCTPNNLAEDEEYAKLCEFAREQGAAYVLMNPLSQMGRGVKSARTLARPDEHMRHIHQLTEPFAADLDMVHIRFPNDDKPLAGCEAGTIIYVFTPGEVTVCPYLVFAARTPQSRHADTEFIVGNIFTDPDIATRLDAYNFHQRYRVGDNPTCGSCSIADGCGKGCPAAVVAAGERIGALDAEVCPVTTGGRRVLPVVATS